MTTPRRYAGAQDPPKTVKRLVEDVRSVETVLELLHSIEKREWDSLGAGVAERAKTATGSTMQACDLFRAEL